MSSVPADRGDFYKNLVIFLSKLFSVQYIILSFIDLIWVIEITEEPHQVIPPLVFQTKLDPSLIGHTG